MFEMNNLFNMISCGLIFSDRNFFNCFAHVLFNYFARIFNCFSLIFFNNLVCLIFVLIISLGIFLIPILFLLWNYTITIDSNVRNIF